MKFFRKIWYWRDNTSLDLRWRVVKKALTIRGERTTEDLSFMLDHRFFDYSCRASEYRGKREAYFMARSIFTKDFYGTMEQRIKFIDSCIEGNTSAREYLKEQYLSGAKYF